MKQNLAKAELFPELEELTPELRTFAQEIIEQTAQEDVSITVSPPEIINHHTAEGLARFQEVMARCENKQDTARFNPKPFFVAHQELFQLALSLENIPDNRQAMIDYMVSQLQTKVQKASAEKTDDDTPNISSEQIRSLIEANADIFIKDLIELRKLAIQLGGNDQNIENDSRWIWFPESQELIKMIGTDAYHLLLSKSRALGLIPFQALDKLRHLKIRCAGASAVTYLLDLLVSVGAMDLKFWDGGTIETSNLSRLTQNVKDLGKGKATSLQVMLNNKNPYAHIAGTQGKVLPDEVELEEGDIHYNDFLSDAEFVIEVIDDAAGKISLRLYIGNEELEIPLLYLADVADAFAGLENTLDTDHFNQQIPEEVFSKILEKLEEIKGWKDKHTRELAKAEHNLRAVVLMLHKNFPESHQFQFLAMKLGLVPFWSQLGVSARESAAIGFRLIMQHLMQQAVTGQNFTSDKVAHTLVPEYKPENLKILQELMAIVFGFPKEFYRND